MIWAKIKLGLKLLIVLRGKKIILGLGLRLDVGGSDSCPLSSPPIYIHSGPTASGCSTIIEK